MKRLLIWASFYSFLFIGIAANTGCRVTQEQKLGGEARATIVVSYPAAEACFDDQRLGTTEQLLRCLELTTGQRYIIDATGAVVEAIAEELGGGAVDAPENMTGSN